MNANEIKEAFNALMNEYANDKAAIAYIEEACEMTVAYHSKPTFNKTKELLVNWMMKPNHDIRFEFLGDVFSERLVIGEYEFCFIKHPMCGDTNKVIQMAFEAAEEVKVRKVAIAKMNESKKVVKVVKVVEEVNVDTLKNTINNLRDRNGELFGMVSKKSNEIKDANNEIAILKKMLMDAKFEIENLKKVNDDLVIYKELVEDYAEVA